MNGILQHINFEHFDGGRRVRDRTVVEFTTTMQSSPIITNVVSSNASQAMQYYVIKFVSDLSAVFSGTLVSSTNKSDSHDITEILLKVALNTINLNPNTLMPGQTT